MRSVNSAALLALFGGATAIGFAPLFVKVSECGPSATAFYRLLFALPLLWFLLGLDQRKPGRPPGPATAGDFLKLALTGLFFAGDLGMWHWSLKFTSVANSTLLTNFAPVLVTIGAWAFFAERITRRFVVGLGLALAGAVMLVSSSLKLSREHLFGDALAIVTTIFYAAYLLCVSWLRKSFSGPTIMAWSGLVSCPTFALVAWLSREQMSPVTAHGWLVVIGLAVVSHVGGQSLIAYAFGHLPASLSSVGLLWQPVVAALLAWMLLKEPLGWMQAMGGVVTLAGIAVASGTLSGKTRAGSM